MLCIQIIQSSTKKITHFLTVGANMMQTLRLFIRESETDIEAAKKVRGVKAKSRTAGEFLLHLLCAVAGLYRICDIDSVGSCSAVSDYYIW